VRVVTDNLGFLLGGLLVTLELTVLGFVGALLLGTVLAVFRGSPIAPLRWVGAGYVEVLRNMPLLTVGRRGRAASVTSTGTCRICLVKPPADHSHGDLCLD
jgi:hypothetical protein